MNPRVVALAFDLLARHPGATLIVHQVQEDGAWVWRAQAIHGGAACGASSPNRDRALVQAMTGADLTPNAALDCTGSEDDCGYHAWVGLLETES